MYCFWTERAVVIDNLRALSYITSSLVRNLGFEFDLDLNLSQCESVVKCKP